MLPIFLSRFFGMSDYILHLCKTAVDENGPQYNHSVLQIVQLYLFAPYIYVWPRA